MGKPSNVRGEYPHLVTARDEALGDLVSHAPATPTSRRPLVAEGQYSEWLMPQERQLALLASTCGHLGGPGFSIAQRHWSKWSTNDRQFYTLEPRDKLSTPRAQACYTAPGLA